MAKPRRAGPTRSIFMITVVDQQRPWLTPRNTLAKTTHSHVGANITRKGTGRPTSHPATRIPFRPTTSEARPAKRLLRALTAPKLMMKERMTLLEARPNSCSPRRGTTVRSRPTMAPTKALTNTRSANFGRLARRPSTGACAVAEGCKVGFVLGQTPVLAADLLHEVRRWRQVLGHELNELLTAA